MIFVVDAGNRALFAADLADMHRHRKAAFVDRAGWEIPVVADQERDQYDLREDTVYLLAKDAPGGPLLASTRLLTTTGSHLMSELFSVEARDRIPRGPAVLEASRFCTTPRIRLRRQRHALLWQIISGVIETALLYGVDEVIFAANSALLPLALKCGWEARSLGMSAGSHGHEATAVAAAITTAGLRRMRQLHGIPAPIIRIATTASHATDNVDARLSAESALNSPSTGS